jgi:hypothetical protein
VAPGRGNPPRIAGPAPLDDGATKAAVCRIFSIRRSTLIDSPARIGWSAALNVPGDTADARQQLTEAQIAALFALRGKRPENKELG